MSVAIKPHRYITASHEQLITQPAEEAISHPVVRVLSRLGVLLATSNASLSIRPILKARDRARFLLATV